MVLLGHQPLAKKLGGSHLPAWQIPRPAYAIDRKQVDG
jgi:hypothetical protein